MTHKGPSRHGSAVGCRSLFDIRFKRINYNESVRPKIYDRMISERRQIAERFLSEGNGEAARIQGNRVRDLNKIQSEAYRAVEEIRGAADAAIYADAYNVDTVSVEFYDFTRTMQAYGDMISDDTTLVLTTDSDLFRFLRGMNGDGETVRDPLTAPREDDLASTHQDRARKEAAAPIATRTDAEPGQ